MITYTTKWWLLHTLAEKCIKGNSTRIGAMAGVKELMKRHPETFGKIPEALIKEVEAKEPEETFIRLTLITGACAERKRFKWLFKDEKKEEARKRRFMAMYKKIFEDAEIEGLVRIMNPKDIWMGEEGEKYLAITGPGWTFSRVDSLIHQLFFAKYRGWVTSGFILLAFFFKDWLINITAPFSPWW